MSFDVDQVKNQTIRGDDPDQSAVSSGRQNEDRSFSRGAKLVWFSTRILWDQQILLLWILLTPVFLGSVLLVFAAPLFFRDRVVENADNDVPANQKSAERKAA